MELQIFKNTSLREAREKFSHLFPFLKLEFFVYRHHNEDAHLENKAYNGRYLAETSEFFKDGTIYFSPSTTVAELEQEFQIELGLAVKVFRRADDTWVDTSQTSHLSLGKHNNMGGAKVRPQFNWHTLFL